MGIVSFLRATFIGKRQTVPDVCYATCNNAYIEAQKLGRAPALCESNSTFQEDYKGCTECALANGDSLTVANSVVSEFTPFLDYCAGLSTSNATEQAIISSMLSVGSEVASLQSEVAYISTKGITTVTEIASSTLAIAAITPTATSTPTLSRIPQPPSHTWIIGAVLGPLILIVAAAITTFTILRRRKRAALSGFKVVQDKGYHYDDSGGKTQLHADSIQIAQQLHGDCKAFSLHELDNGTTKWELPAVEAAAVELATAKVD